MLEIDVGGHTAFYYGQPIRLTKQKINLLDALARARGRVLTKDQLISLLWSLDEPENADDALKVVMCQLRRKLKPWPAIQIKTCVGGGYRLELPKQGLRTHLSAIAEVWGECS